MKFTPEEMAIDAGEIDASKWPIIARGPKEWRKYLSFKRGYVRLAQDVRNAFPDDRAVNEALRKVLELKQLASANGKRKKSA